MRHHYQIQFKFILPSRTVQTVYCIVQHRCTRVKDIFSRVPLYMFNKAISPGRIVVCFGLRDCIETHAMRSVTN